MRRPQIGHIVNWQKWNITNNKTIKSHYSIEHKQILFMEYLTLIHRALKSNKFVYSQNYLKNIHNI